MAGGKEGRSLEETPTWAVAVVCFVLVLISILIEYVIHLIGKVRKLIKFKYVIDFFSLILRSFLKCELMFLI